MNSGVPNTIPSWVKITEPGCICCSVRDVASTLRGKPVILSVLGVGVG